MKNKWEFSKMAINGLIRKKGTKPTYDKSTADIYYPKVYSEEKLLDTNELKWLPSVSNIRKRKISFISI